MSLTDALSGAYNLGNADKCSDAAQILRSGILNAYKNNKELPWPPTADDMELNAENFLAYQVPESADSWEGSKRDKGEGEALNILNWSRPMLRCYYGTWKLPKHILLCVTVRHLFRSKKLTSILNRLGHSESYDFGLELETFLTKALDESSSHLTPQIIKGEGNIVFHCEWDNLNKTTTNLLGSSIVHSAGGIMLQEVRPGFDNVCA